MNKTPFTLALASLALVACQQEQSPPPLQGAEIGGSFTLTGEDGDKVSDTDFAGKYRLVYFGYTSCPDVCPVDVQNLMAGLKQFEKAAPDRGEKIQPLMITVDPERDTPEIMAEYTAAFHDRLIGLTGTPEEIAGVAKKFAVYFQKEPGSSPEHYLVAHAQMPVLLDPEGKPLALMPVDDPTTEPNEGSAQLVADELEKWVS